MPPRPNDLFVDTAGWAAIADRTQPHHAKALAESGRVVGGGATLVTTSLVLTELTALLTSPIRLSKPERVRFIRQLRADPAIEVVFIDQALDAAAWRLLEQRPDKDWSLVDCASFVVMGQRGLTDALTGDHHFTQAGFARLLV